MTNMHKDFYTYAAPFPLYPYELFSDIVLDIV